MNIKVNLYKDWIEITLRIIEELKHDGFKFDYKKWESRQFNSINKQISELSSQGRDVSKIKRQKTRRNLESAYNRHLIYVYLDFNYRLISPQKRDIYFSKEFVCPDELKQGLDYLVNKIKNGNSLFPHLSRRIFIADTQDGMLFDWGIQHLHLGIEPDEKYPRMVQGNSEILYCIVKDDIVYFIQINHHGKWADKDLLRIVKNNWPQLLSPYKMKGILRLEKDISEDEHLQLRSAGVNTITDLDGEYYFSPGGGINSAKGSTKSTATLQNTVYWLENAEKIIVEQTKSHLALIEREVGQPLKDVKYNLKKIQSNKMIINDIGNNIQVVLNINEKNDQFEGILFKKLINI